MRLSLFCLGEAQKQSYKKSFKNKGYLKRMPSKNSLVAATTENPV